MLKLHTEWSNRKIAEKMGVSKNTVAKYREELVATGQIDQLDKLTGKDGKERPREIKQPSWRDDASPTVIDFVEQNVFSKNVAKLLAKYDHQAQDVIAKQIEAMTERPSNDILIESIQKSEGVAETFQQWIEKFGDAAETPEMETEAEVQPQEAEVLETEEPERTPPIEAETQADEQVELAEAEAPVEIEPPQEPQADESAETELKSPASETERQMDELEDIEPSEEELNVIEQSNDIASLIDTEEEPIWKKEGYKSKEEYDADYAILTDNVEDTTPKESEHTYSGFPEEWDTFGEYYKWIEDYAYKLLSQEDISFVSRIHRVLEIFAKQLGDDLEELRAEQD